MKCNNCGKKIEDNSYIFCNNCGHKLDSVSNKNTNVSKINNTNIKDDSNNFLIIGIVLSLCCSLPFGVAVILINELKYKKLINDGLVEEAKKYRNIMIILSVIGFLVFFGYLVFKIVLTILEVLLSTG